MNSLTNLFFIKEKKRKREKEKKLPQPSPQPSPFTYICIMSTASQVFPRPVQGDCDPYYFNYINLVPDVDILTYLHTQRDWFEDWIRSLDDDEAKHRYAPGKWSLAEMIGHILDAERVFAYRMMAMSRGDENKLPGFEQDDYVRNSNYHHATPEDLAREWNAVRSATIYLARNTTAEMAARTGTANNVQARASVYVYIMAGHVNHHYRIGKERYLGQVAE